MKVFQSIISFRPLEIWSEDRASVGWGSCEWASFEEASALWSVLLQLSIYYTSCEEIQQYICLLWGDTAIYIYISPLRRSNHIYVDLDEQHCLFCFWMLGLKTELNVCFAVLGPQASQSNQLVFWCLGWQGLIRQEVVQGWSSWSIIVSESSPLRRLEKWLFFWIWIRLAQSPLRRWYDNCVLGTWS